MLTYAYMHAQVLDSSHVVTQAAIAEFLDKWRDTRQALLDPHMAHDLKVYACVHVFVRVLVSVPERTNCGRRSPALDISIWRMMDHIIHFYLAHDGSYEI